VCSESWAEVCDNSASSRAPAGSQCVPSCARTRCKGTSPGSSNGVWARRELVIVAGGGWGYGVRVRIRVFRNADLGCLAGRGMQMAEVLMPRPASPSWPPSGRQGTEKEARNGERGGLCGRMVVRAHGGAASPRAATSRWKSTRAGTVVQQDGQAAAGGPVRRHASLQRRGGWWWLGIRVFATSISDVSLVEGCRWLRC